ncbi:transposase [Hydrogenophaga aromaticivorans]|uniref:transposase n=1 Tax=Hydrogenophaga aromaticivorans TaxID=2610898 RepID=UPI0015A3E704
MITPKHQHSCGLQGSFRVDYVTSVHDLQQKRLLFVTEGRDHQTLDAFAKDLAEHGGSAQAISHVSMDMSAAYLKGVGARQGSCRLSHAALS